MSVTREFQKDVSQRQRWGDLEMEAILPQTRQNTGLVVLVAQAGTLPHTPQDLRYISRTLPRASSPSCTFLSPQVR